jgi:hypothetical protein
MKSLFTSLQLRLLLTPVLLCAGMIAGQDSRASESAFQSFDNATVISVSKTGVTLDESDDGRGLLIHFASWNAGSGERIRKSLSRSPLQYRQLPGRQGMMTLEVYSRDKDVAFASKMERRELQILVGEERRGRVMADLLEASADRIPLPGGAIAASRGGKIGETAALLEADASKDQESILKAARAVLAMSAHTSGRVACLEHKPAHFDSIETAEGALLNAWCHLFQGNEPISHDIVVQALRSNLPDSFKERVNGLKRHLALKVLYEASRESDPLHVALTLQKYRDVLMQGDTSVFTYEIITHALQDSGLRYMLKDIADQLIVNSSDERLQALGPLVAECYLMSGNPVRSQDVASFFLEKKQPHWRRSRLLAIRGQAYLRDGNWAAAVQDLARSQVVSSAMRTEETLSFIEAVLRSRGALSSVDARLVELVRDPALKMTALQRNWFKQLLARYEVESLRMPSGELVELVPAHSLVRSANAAAVAGNGTMEMQLLDAAAKQPGGWADLAKLSMDAKKLSSRFVSLKELLED